MNGSLLIKLLVWYGIQITEGQESSSLRYLTGSLYLREPFVEQRVWVLQQQTALLTQQQDTDTAATLGTVATQLRAYLHTHAAVSHTRNTLSLPQP